MKCPKCKSEIEEGAVFCTHCGKSLPRRKKCVSCGTELPMDIAFCTNCGAKQSIDGGNNNQQDKEIANNSKRTYMILAIVITITIAICTIFYTQFYNPTSITPNTITPTSPNSEYSFKDIQITKYFVNENNVYHYVNVKIMWPESLDGSDVKPLQMAIMNKTFGFSKSNIDDALSDYFSSFGKEIEQKPEWDIMLEQYDVTLEVKEECNISGKYLAYSIFNMKMGVGGSIHAADVINRYVNYDIKNQMALTMSDIFNDNISHIDIMNEIKRNSTGEWSNVVDSEKLPKEVLLTNTHIHFIFDGWQPRIEKITTPLPANILSDRIKKLFSMENVIKENNVENKEQQHSNETLKNDNAAQIVEQKSDNSSISSKKAVNKNTSDNVLTIYGEPAYLMTEEDVKKELVGSYYWQCDPEGSMYFNSSHNTFAFSINNNNLTMKNDFVKNIYDDVNTGNVNGKVPVKAKYEKGKWYKQKNSKNKLTMYFFVGYEINVEVLCYADSQWIGNEVLNTPQNPKSYIVILNDDNGKWAYYSKDGQYEMKKK